jgi:alpha-L-arabinofuranosidase
VRHGIERCVGGQKSMLGDAVPGSIETGRWYDIRIELKGPRIRCYLDGQLIHDVEDAGPPVMAAVAGLADGSRELILKVVNVSDAAQYTEVKLDGAGDIAPEGTAVTLTANGPDDENSLAQPARVAPVAQRVQGFGPRFAYTFPPQSLTVLRLKLRQ